jgi:hypothetical protein
MNKFYAASKSLLGSNDQSLGWDIVNNKSLYDNCIINSYPANKPLGYQVGDRIVVILDLDEGSISFCDGDEKLGKSLIGLELLARRNQQLWPAVSITEPGAVVEIRALTRRAGVLILYLLMHIGLLAQHLYHPVSVHIYPLINQFLLVYSAINIFNLHLIICIYVCYLLQNLNVTIRICTYPYFVLMLAFVFTRVYLYLSSCTSDVLYFLNFSLSLFANSFSNFTPPPSHLPSSSVVIFDSTASLFPPP